MIYGAIFKIENAIVFSWKSNTLYSFLTVTTQYKAFAFKNSPECETLSPM